MESVEAGSLWQTPCTPTRLRGQASRKSAGPRKPCAGEAVLDASKMILLGAPLNEILATITRRFQAHSEGTSRSIFLLDEDGLHLRGRSPKTRPRRTGQDGSTGHPSNVGSCGTAAYLRQPVFVSDIASDPKWVQFRSLCSAEWIRAAWSSPIMSHDDKVLGTFCMYHRAVRHPGPSEIQLIDHASRIAGIAIERDRSESTLRQAYRELRQLVDFLPQHVIVLDAEGSLLQANQELLLDFYGRTLDEVQGAGTTERVKRDVHPDDLERVRSERQDGFTKRAPFEIEKRLLGKDGRYRWFLFRYKPMPNEEGAVLRWYATATDIEDRKRTEEACELPLTRSVSRKKSCAG